MANVRQHVMQRRTPIITRHTVLHDVRRRLEETSFPRVEMSVIVGLTGAIGLLCSFLLLRGGVDSMAFRYPLALACAYLFFLGSLWLWMRTRADDYLDLPDLGNVAPERAGDGGPEVFSSGGGGQFDGGGASGTFEGPRSLPMTDSPASSAGDASGSLDLDPGEAVIPVIAVVLAVGLAFASLNVVYVAPALFAELLFDGVLSYSLYRHLRTLHAKHWLATAVRRTALPFGITAVFLALVGVAMAAYAPGARSVGEVVHFPRAAR